MGYESHRYFQYIRETQPWRTRTHNFASRKSYVAYVRTVGTKILGTKRRERVKKKRCTSRLTLVPSSISSSNVYPLTRYRSVPKRRSSIGETFLLFFQPVYPSASVLHRSNNPLQPSPLTHSKISIYDEYGNLNLCLNTLFQEGQSGSGFSM